MKKLLILACAISALGVYAASEATSGNTFIYVDTAESSFWRTATNNVVELSIDYPETATSASLTVAGAYGYSASYSDVPEGRYAVALPAASSPETEDVYDFTLTFSDGTERNARFAVIAGVSDRPEGTARCVRSSASSSWSKVHNRAVIPVPYGTTSLTVGGNVVDTGLGGAQGWFAYGPVAARQSQTLQLTTPEDVWRVLLTGFSEGFFISIH